MKRLLNRPLAVGLIAALMALAPLPAHADSIKPFLGKFEGKATSKLPGAVSARDFSLEVKQRDKGFSLIGTTLIPKNDGSYKRRKYLIHFVEVEGRKVYAAAARRNMFGKAVPNDPIRGRPYMWARIKGNTLSVYGIHVTQDGGYELQIYHRTLMDGGLKLTFRRIRNGKELRDITGVAKRVK